MAASLTDSAATVRVEVQEAAELVSAEMEYPAWSSRKESLLLQRFAVNLINSNNATDKIPILLIGESTIVCRPGKLAWRLWMIWIVYEIAISGIRRRRLQLKNQNRMIDAEPGISGEKRDEQLAACQCRVQPGMSLFLIAFTILKHHPGITNSKVTRPTVSDA